MLALLLQAGQPASSAPIPSPPLHGGPQEVTCPVGGERFPAWQASMYSTFGERPDGKPYSYLPFPFPLPECPGNKLIVFDDFTPSQTAVLARLITTVEYRRLIDTDSTYYRAYWLATRLERPKTQILGLLLSAIWQASPSDIPEPVTGKDGTRLARYQSEFISQVGRLGPAVGDRDRSSLQARAANAARQMKQFVAAERLRKQAEKSLASVPAKGGWDIYLTKLRAVIARKDASVEPLDMIPEQQVAFTCMRQQPSNAFDRTVCATPTIAARIAELRTFQP